MIERNIIDGKVTITLSVSAKPTDEVYKKDLCPICSSRYCSDWSSYSKKFFNTVEFLTGAEDTRLCKGCNTSIAYHVRNNKDIEIISTKVIVNIIERNNKDIEHLKKHHPSLLKSTIESQITALIGRW